MLSGGSFGLLCAAFPLLSVSSASVEQIIGLYLLSANPTFSESDFELIYLRN